MTFALFCRPLTMALGEGIWEETCSQEKISEEEHLGRWILEDSGTIYEHSAGITWDHLGSCGIILDQV